MKTHKQVLWAWLVGVARLDGLPHMHPVSAVLCGEGREVLAGHQRVVLQHILSHLLHTRLQASSPSPLHTIPTPTSILTALPPSPSPSPSPSRG